MRILDYINKTRAETHGPKITTSIKNIVENDLGSRFRLENFSVPDIKLVNKTQIRLSIIFVLVLKISCLQFDFLYKL